MAQRRWGHMQQFWEGEVAWSIGKELGLHAHLAFALDFFFIFLWPRRKETKTITLKPIHPPK